jgi:hypothetical protein
LFLFRINFGNVLGTWPIFLSIVVLGKPRALIPYRPWIDTSRQVSGRPDISLGAASQSSSLHPLGPPLLVL